MPDADEQARSERGEWISAQKALATLSAGGDSPRAIADMLGMYLRQGQLNARARQVWRSGEKTVKRAWKNGPSYDRNEPHQPVPVAYWRQEIDPIGDRERWRWIASRFVVTTRSKPIQRILMRGVQFSLDDLIALQPERMSRSQPTPKRKRGPSADIAKRDLVWNAALTAILQQAVRFVDPPSPAWIIERVTEALSIGPEGKLRAGENQIEQVASMVAAAVKDAPRVAAAVSPGKA